MGIRLSVIGEMDVNLVGDSSILLVGDGGRARLENQSIAFLLAYARTDGTLERDFSDYPIFRRIVPPFPEGREEIRFRRRNENPLIAVKKLKVGAAIASAMVQAGTIGSIGSISRSHSIRQVSPEKRLEQSG